MKQDEYSTANQLWNAGATEVLTVQSRWKSKVCMILVQTTAYNDEQHVDNGFIALLCHYQW